MVAYLGDGAGKFGKARQGSVSSNSFQAALVELVAPANRERATGAPRKHIMPQHKAQKARMY